MSLRYIYRLLAVLACFSFLLLGANYFYFYYQEKPETGILSMLPQVQNQTRLLVIAPHCDDETLGCGGIIQDVLAAGGEVMIVIMTNGDGFTFAAQKQFHRLFLTSSDYIQSGYSRQREAVNALRCLGLSENQIVFLGYPDRGLKALWADYWDGSQPYQSRYTQSDHAPYSNSYQKNAPYAGEAVLANLEQIMRDFKPTLILSPHPADEHPDHAATWAFVTTTLIRMKSDGLSPDPQLYTYLIHRGDFPIPHGYRSEAPLLPPRPLYQSHNNQWKLYSLIGEHEAIKEQALKGYVSQLRIPIMSSLLYSFIRQNELFEEVVIPVAERKPPDLALFSAAAWLDLEAVLVNPPGVNALGALERRAKLSAIASVVQDNVIWLRFHIPEYARQRNQYHVVIMEFHQQHRVLQREKRVFSFSAADTKVPSDNMIQSQDDVIVKIPYPEQGLPDFFFIQVLTKDIFGASINHTVWQPVLVHHAR